MRAMKRINLALRLSLVLAIAVLAATASASSSDFKNRFEIGTTTSPDRLAVAGDRFVIALDLGAQSLTFIDTWNWAVCGSLSLGSTAEIKHMAINPSQTTLYLASDNGNIRKIDLTALPDTPFNGPLPTLSLEPATTFFSSDNLIDISVISPTGSSTVDCLFVQIQRESSEELSWAIFGSDTVLLTAPTPLLTADTIIEASASPNLLLAKYFSTPLAETILYGYRCQPYEFEPIYIAPLTLDNGGDHFRGIAINQSNDKFVIGNIGNPAGSLANLELYSLDQLLWNTWLDQFDVSTTKTFMPLLFKNFISEAEPVLFFARDEDYTLNVLELAGDTAFSEAGSTVKFSAVIRNLTGSSAADGFVYASLVNSSTVNVITPNPFVKKLSTSGAITTDNFTLTINYDNSGPRPPLTYIVAECPVFSISPDGCSRIIVNNQALVGAGGTENVVLSSQDVGECSHILGVFVQDGNTPAKHQGRNAIEVSVDIPPLAQDFDLGFWDQTIIFEFTAQDLCDLASFEIHYGDSPAPPPSGGAPGNPPSPIIISNADPGKDYRIEIKGLVNGTVYYGQIITKDKAGNSSASKIKQTMPQPVETHTDIVHEKGGFSCAISPGPGDPSARASDLALLLCPLVMLLGLFARRTFLRLFSTWGQASSLMTGCDDEVRPLPTKIKSRSEKR